MRLREVFTTALLYVAAGLSVIPIKPDGSKSPALKEWKPFQFRRPTVDELQVWFDNDAGYGLAVIGGEVSSGLVVLDFDHDAARVFPLWREVVESQYEGLFSRLVIVQTPGGGYHVYYFCSQVMGSKKLAQKLIEVPEGTDRAQLIDSQWMKRVTVIETKARGGYVLAPGCPPECHPTNKTYELLAGELINIQTVTPDEQTIMLDAARSFNEYVKATNNNWTRTITKPTTGTRPGDDFNNKGDWFELLIRHGWIYAHRWNEVTYWRRPGKSGPGISATTNYAGSNSLYVFSTNASPFEERQGYSLFSAYTLLEHGGDFHLAAKALSEQGYGEQKRPKTILPLHLEPISKPQKTMALKPVERPKDTIKLSSPSRPSATRLLNSEVTR